MTSQILSYKYPFLGPAVSGLNEQWVSHNPSNASTNTSFTSNGQSDVIFHIQSNSQFLRTHHSFMTFNMTVRMQPVHPLPALPSQQQETPTKESALHSPE